MLNGIGKQVAIAVVAGVISALIVKRITGPSNPVKKSGYWA